MTVDRWERRQLCEEGTCIGVIGAEGTCKTCGRPAPDWGDLRKPGRVSSQSEVDEAEAEGEAEAGIEEAPPASPAKVAASASKVSAWNERRLCSDGTCIGLIADDGKCKVCRKAADGTADEADEALEDEVAEGDDGEDAEDGEDDEDDEDDDDDDEVAQDEDGETGDADDEDDEDEDDDDDDDDDKVAAKSVAGKSAKPVDDDDRALCSDGTCIGLIGDNGKCKVCGKAAA